MDRSVDRNPMDQNPVPPIPISQISGLLMPVSQSPLVGIGGMQNVIELRCLRCGQRYAPTRIDYLCACRPNLGSDLGTLDVEYDYMRVGQAMVSITPSGQTGMLPAMARYAPLLPLENLDSLSSVLVGDTPLHHAPRLGRELGFSNLWIKDEGRNPSGSLKDRASALAVAKAQEKGQSIVATASTGNAAAALAQQAAAAGLGCVIFMPQHTPAAKIAQLLAFGAKVFAVRGTYDQAYDLCVTACERFGWYNRNTGMNPYMSEGKKTVALEIAEQLAALPEPRGQAETGLTAPRFVAPDAVFVGVGDGCIIGGVYKGFYDLIRLGQIERLPRIYGVQSEQSCALYRAWRNNLDVPEPVQATTRADSINVDAPRDAVKALRAVRATDGAFLTVADAEILQAIPHLARKAAVFAEPAGAAALAGFLAAARSGLIATDETVVLINTGSGLKDIQAVRETGNEPIEIDTDLDAVTAWVTENESV